MRGSKDAIAGLSQWIGRKLCNHDPLHEVEKVPHASARKTTANVRQRTGIVEDGKVFHMMKNGRRFMITIEEMTEEEETPSPLQKVSW